MLDAFWWALYAGTLRSGKGLPVSFGTNTGGVMLGLNVGEGADIGLTLGSVFEPKNVGNVILLIIVHF